MGVDYERPFGQPALVSDEAATRLRPSGFDQAQGDSPEPEWLHALRDMAFVATVLVLLILLPICIIAYLPRPQGALPNALPHQGVTTSVPSSDDPKTRAEAGVSTDHAK